MRRDMLFRWNSDRLTHPDAAFKAECKAGANRSAHHVDEGAAARTRQGAKAPLRSRDRPSRYFNSSER